MSPKQFYWFNGFLSCGAVLFLFWLIYFRTHTSADPDALSFLPLVNAGLNGTCALLLGIGFWAIKNKHRSLHQFLMSSAFIFSTIFLVCYIYYHSQHGDTPYPGQGWIRPLYFFILISHVVLSIIVFPMILTTLFFALTKRFSLHRKIAPWTWPIWMYVSVTGVMVYLFLYGPQL